MEKPKIMKACDRLGRKAEFQRLTRKVAELLCQQSCDYSVAHKKRYEDQYCIFMGKERTVYSHIFHAIGCITDLYLSEYYVIRNKSHAHNEPRKWGRADMFFSYDSFDYYLEIKSAHHAIATEEIRESETDGWTSLYNQIKKIKKYDLKTARCGLFPVAFYSAENSADEKIVIDRINQCCKKYKPRIDIAHYWIVPKHLRLHLWGKKNKYVYAIALFWKFH